MKSTPNNVKGRFFLHLISLLIFLTGTSELVFAQPVSVDFYGKAVIGSNPTTIIGNLTLKTTGELYLGSHSPYGLQTNTLILTGNYTGEAGSKVFLSVTDNTNETGTKGFIDIIGTANKSIEATTVELDLFNGWNGSNIDLIRATRTYSDTNTFRMDETRYGNHIAVLLHRIEGNSLIWYLAEKAEIKPCLNLIYQKLNNTLVVNNNPATNGGYQFAYYVWHKNGVKIGEGNHDDFGGHYYTGGASLEPYSEYWVELIDIKGDKYRSCPFTPTIQTLTTTIRAYPNPVTEKSSHTVTIEVEGIEETALQSATIDVFSTLGAHINKVRVEGRYRIPVILPNVAGLYILQFKSDTGNREIKIIVE